MDALIVIAAEYVSQRLYEERPLLESCTLLRIMSYLREEIEIQENS